MTGEARRSAIIVIPTGGAATLEALREDPDAYSYCIHDDGSVAVAVFATPDGTSCDPDVRVAPLCHQHITEEEPRGLLLTLYDPEWVEEHCGDAVYPDRDALVSDPSCRNTLRGVLGEVVDVCPVPIPRHRGALARFVTSIARDRS